MEGPNGGTQWTDRLGRGFAIPSQRKFIIRTVVGVACTTVVGKWATVGRQGTVDMLVLYCT
jgi:hypothetical protein